MRRLSYRLVTMTSMHNQPHRIMAFMNQPWSRKSLMSCRILFIHPVCAGAAYFSAPPLLFLCLRQGGATLPRPACDTANRTDSRRP